MKTLNEKALEMPLADALRHAARGGVVIKRKGKKDFALMPLSDDLLDFLLETSPKLIRECQEIGKRMEAGERYRLEDVIAELGIKIPEDRPSNQRRGRAISRARYAKGRK